MDVKNKAKNIKVDLKGKLGSMKKLDVIWVVGKGGYAYSNCAHAYKSNFLFCCKAGVDIEELIKLMLIVNHMHGYPYLLQQRKGRAAS